MLTPVALLWSLLAGLLSLAFPIVGIALIRHALRPRRPRPVVAQRTTGEVVVTREAEPDRLRDPSVLVPFLAGVLLLLITVAGGPLFLLAFPIGPDEPSAMRTGAAQSVRGIGNSTIHTETYGPANGPILVLTHGWGTNSTEWYYAKKQLADKFRLIVWDSPGLGESTQPENREFALERMAADLHSVLSLAQGKPVILVGHSIGGMVNLTFCRLYPELIGKQVAGVVQLDTSYTDPVKTAQNSSLNEALQKPVAEPILHAMIALSPLVRAMNWMSYQNGMSHLMNAQSAFAGSETRGQLDLVSRYQYESSPAVVARGTLGMFHWDATPEVPRVNAPVLILVGRQDTTTLPRASEYMHQHMPESELRIIDPSAHYALLEKNEQVNAAIAQFASQHLQ